MSYLGPKAIGEFADSTIVTITGTQALTNKTINGRDPTADGAKLDGIEASADVTDYTNVSGAGAAMTNGATFTGAVVVDNKLDIEDVVEKVYVFGQGAGTFTFNTKDQAIAYDTTATSANRGINFTFVNSEMTNGQSKTLTWILTMGATAYYPTTVSIDSVDVTSSVKWQGGSAPTSGNANSLDIYTFTIIKTADATFTVLAAQTQFAQGDLILPMLASFGGGSARGFGFRSISDPPFGDQVFTSSGTFTVPAGVTFISAVAIGGGGGGMYYANSSVSHTYAMNGGAGGGLAWFNGLAVTPGQIIDVTVGLGGVDGAYSAGSTDGGTSILATGGFNIATAKGGLAGRYSLSRAIGGTYTFNTARFTFASTGGGFGGGNTTTNSTGYGPAGGGGAGGYTGGGGDGRDDNAASGDSGLGGGASGGGAAGNSTYTDHISGGGGGTGLYGEGPSGVGQADGSGQGGSGGGDSPVPTNVNGSQVGGLYGGGGGGKSSNYWGSHAGNGAPGAVRILWGEGRAFPSTNVGA